MRAMTQRKRSGVRSSTASNVFETDLDAGVDAGISDSLASPLGVFLLYFLDGPGCARAFVRGIFGAYYVSLKVMRDGRIEVAANCVGHLGNVPARGFVALLRPDGHLQDLALAVRARALFRHLLSGLPALSGNIFRILAVCHTHLSLQVRWRRPPQG